MTVCGFDIVISQRQLLYSAGIFPVDPSQQGGNPEATVHTVYTVQSIYTSNHRTHSAEPLDRCVVVNKEKSVETQQIPVEANKK